ncbi:MAG: glycerophosphodiester phosphodiesterase [Acidimicrobiales bacterium]|nr:glycerophosphodiester phosphodiesterase [Acidimicrobiales bacterium]
MANPWRARRVLAYAHRGGAKEGPSATLYAMHRALEAGADALELDVHATADGHVVCCHDPTVDATTDGTGAIAELTLAEVQALDAAYWFVPGGEDGTGAGLPDEAYPLRGLASGDPSLRIPTLEEVLVAFPGTLLNLDIKQSEPVVAPYEDKVARVLSAFGREGDVIVTSFNDTSIERFSELAPGVPTAAGTLAAAAFWRAVQSGEPPPQSGHVALQVPTEAYGLKVVDRRFVDTAHEADLAVHVWTIDEADEMRRLIELGVDGIMSDRPSLLVSTLAELGVNWSR